MQLPITETRTTSKGNRRIISSSSLQDSHSSLQDLYSSCALSMQLRRSSASSGSSPCSDLQLSTSDSYSSLQSETHPAHTGELAEVTRRSVKMKVTLVP